VECAAPKSSRPVNPGKFEGSPRTMIDVAPGWILRNSEIGRPDVTWTHNAIH
jgi:hypothetical protein